MQPVITVPDMSSRALIEKALQEVGWRISVSGKATSYCEPRTGLDFSYEEASRILQQHSNGGTKVLAVEIGTPQHGDAYGQFKEPLRRLTNSTVMKTGWTCPTTGSLSVWILPTKDVEQFLSTLGHKYKPSTTKRKAITGPPATGHME